jgi:hypothetical protein
LVAHHQAKTIQLQSCEFCFYDQPSIDKSLNQAIFEQLQEKWRLAAPYATV